MLKEPQIIEKFQKLAKELFDSTGLVKVTCTESQVSDNRLLDQRVLPDFAIQVETKEKEKYLIVFEVKSTGQPRYARMAAHQLQSIIDKRKEVYGIFGAPFISEESRQICCEAGIGFLDLAGNCFFRFNNVYINIEGRPNPYPATRPLRSIFAPKSTRALRVPYFLLEDKRKDHTGSLDIDLALDFKKISAESYRTILQLMQERGYRQGEQPFIFYRTVESRSGTTVTVEVDFLAGEYGGTTKTHRTQRVQDVKNFFREKILDISALFCYHVIRKTGNYEIYAKNL